MSHGPGARPARVSASPPEAVTKLGVDPVGIVVAANQPVHGPLEDVHASRRPPVRQEPPGNLGPESVPPTAGMRNQQWIGLGGLANVRHPSRVGQSIRTRAPDNRPALPDEIRPSSKSLRASRNRASSEKLSDSSARDACNLSATARRRRRRGDESRRVPPPVPRAWFPDRSGSGG